MGMSRTWTYSLRFKLASGAHVTPHQWRVKQSGKPTTANIDKWVTQYEKSLTDGVNKHLGPDQVTSAHVIDQRTGDTVATWTRTASRNT